MDLQTKITEFLRIAPQFSLGHLVTESAHPRTQKLSLWAQTDLPLGIEALHEVDQLALATLEREIDGIWLLHQRVAEVLKSGHDILLVGCGATGRLSLVIETLSRQMNHYPGRIRSFMAGGDYALIKSVESFEDRTHYGARQLHDLGFQKGDLLLAITEGGETAFVIGACHEAAKAQGEPPWFLYCNPDSTLKSIQRSQEVIESPLIKKLNLTCGPMALTGSTRMQASTIQMAAAGLAVLYKWHSKAELLTHIQTWQNWFKEQDFQGLMPFIESEAQHHAQNRPITYLSDDRLAISILTDTTERSPTFSQPAFENLQDESPLSPVYLAVKNALTSEMAWEHLLGRTPRCLNWHELDGRIGYDVLLGFDVSQEAVKRRAGEVVAIEMAQDAIAWRGFGHEWQQPLWKSEPLWAHLSLKMAINMLSTLMMGRRGFYLDNVMTWVRPSNNKLIDRASRYVQLLASRRGVQTRYEDVVGEVITMMESGAEGPVVLNVLSKLGVKV